MKIPSLLAVLSGLGLAGAIQAQTTVIDITGATAFRSAAVTSINEAFKAGGSFAAAYTSTASNGSSTAFTDASYQIWRGVFPGIAGTTVIRTSWNGSVEGIRAVADTAGPSTFDQTYLKETEITGLPAANPAAEGIPWGSRDLESSDAEMTFSDVAQSATPVQGSLSGGPVGVVVFTMVANKTWKDDNLGAISISSQQFRALAGTGKLPLSVFTGSSAHTNLVYLTGRNDGSGTRTTYLAETGYGISNPVVQYVVHDRSNATTIDKILKTAKGGAFNFGNSPTTGYASTVWGLDQDGNGGYSSGGDLRTDLTKTSTAAAVWEFEDLDESGTYEASEDSQVTPAAKLYLVSWLSTSDARSARGSGLASAANAQILGFNGSILSGLAGDNPSATLSSADKALVASGKYTAWSYQQLYHLGTAASTTVFNQLKTRLNDATVIGSAGMPLGEMNVSRSADGGVVLPGAL